MVVASLANGPEQRTNNVSDPTNLQDSRSVIIGVMPANGCVFGKCVVGVALFVAGCSSNGGHALDVHAATTSPTRSKTTVSDGPNRAAPVLGNYGDAVNNVGRSQYSDIYAGDYENRDGSVTVYVGPGSDSALLASLRHMSPVGIAGLPSSGAFPILHAVRVPVSISELERQARAVDDARLSLASDGYHMAGMAPIPERGEIDVRFHTVPAGVTVAAATRYIDSAIAPNVVVTSINATYATFG